MSAVVNSPRADTAVSARFRWAGYLLGFALGGFFDGILLHQVLQWHHLLSAVQADALRDLRVQILADGLFHVFMYVVALLGFWQLWRTRREYAKPMADRLLIANALIGFGSWHVLDGVLSHWLLGIHRIRMDAADPLLWDLIWFFAFGVAVTAAGYFLRRRAPPYGPNTRHAPLVLILAVLSAGPIAALPPPGTSTVLVIAKPGVGPAEILDGIVAVNGGALWFDRSGTLWVIRPGPHADPGILYDYGALWVTRSALAFSCLAWSRFDPDFSSPRMGIISAHEIVRGAASDRGA
jgi:uncharacterized membrane protein